MITVVHRTEDADVGASIQGGRSPGVDSKSGDPKIRESRVHYCPRVPAVRRAGDATTLIDTDIEDRRGEGINGKADISTFPIDKTGVHCCPSVPAVRGAENIGASAGIQGGRSKGVDDKRGDLQLA